MLNKCYSYIFIILISTINISCNWLNSKSSITEDNKFEIKDTSLITKIYLADRNGNTITLIKNNETWIINDKFPVRKDAISILLSTANKIRIKKPVSKSAFENVMKFIATTGVLVEFFEGDKMVKSYIIGSNTPDHLGTYMLLKDRKKPFIVHIPSFNGLLSPRYGIQANAVDIINWRSTTVFNLSPNLINHIKYTDYLNQQNSYFLKTRAFELINSKNKSIPLNNNNALKLLNSFKNLNCETFKEEKNKIDFATQLEELVVNFDTLRTYKIKGSETKNKEENFNVDRKYATLNNGDLMLIQDYVFNKVLININELKRVKQK